MRRFYVHSPTSTRLAGHACVEVRPYPEDTPAESLLSLVEKWSPCAVTLLGWPAKTLSILEDVYERSGFSVLRGMTHEESFFYIQLREPSESEEETLFLFRKLASIAAGGLWVEMISTTAFGAISVDPYENYCREKGTVVRWEAEPYLPSEELVPCSPSLER